MRFPSRVAGCLLLCSAVAPRLSAQSPADGRRDAGEAARLPVVQVRAARPIARSGGASALELPLDSIRLEPAPTLQRVMRELPFIQVRTNPRGEAYFTSRGSGFDAREVAVLIDGVPAGLNFDGRTDLAVLPVASARTLTLVRGLPSLLYGPNVLGGVAELTVASEPARGRVTRGATLSAGVDGTGARAASTTLTLAGEGTSWLRAGAGYRRSDGFALPAGINEPAPFENEDRRLNADREQGDAFVAARHEGAEGGWVSFSSMAYSGRRATPAELGVVSPQLLRFPLVQRSFSVLSIGTGERPSLLGGRGALQLGIGYDAGRTRLDAFTTRSYTTLRSQEDADDRTINARLVGRQSLGGDAELSGALTYAKVKRHETLSPGTTSDYRQRLWSAAAEWGFGLPSLAQFPTVRAIVGAVYDASDTPESGGKPALGQLSAWGGRGGVTAMSRDGRQLLHAGLSRRVRFPALREMYSGSLTSVEPNPDLRPEVLVAAEAGMTAQVGGAQLQAVAFRSQITDAIVRTTVNRRVKRVNRDRTRSAGVELLGTVPLGLATLAADLTAQAVTSSDASAGEEYQAEYQPKFAGGLRANAPLPHAFALDVSARVVGAQYCASAANGYDRLAPATRLSADLTRRWRSRLEVTVGLDNLTDGATYDQCGLPLPGRALRLQIAVR